MFYDFAKRFIDIIGSFLALILCFPLIAIFAVLIKLTSSGPIFYRPTRVGKNGRLFKMLKFRSMHMYRIRGKTVHARQYLENNPKLKKQYQENSFKLTNDPRVTPVGKFLRRTKIDELPQLWHILRGQMSLVGPRVHMVSEVDHFRSEYKRIFVLKPGATGLTQIKQASEKPEISFEEEIQLDSFYIENWSIWLDIYIIFKTVLILLGRKPKVDY